MKKWLIALLTLLALSLSVAFAAEANDITEDCKFKVCSSGRKYTLMTDKKYRHSGKFVQPPTARTC